MIVEDGDAWYSHWLGSKPYIAAYHAGARSVNDLIEEDQIVYWYRPTPKSLNCDSTDMNHGSGKQRNR